jgi:hypothetical protein
VNRASDPTAVPVFLGMLPSLVVWSMVWYFALSTRTSKTATAPGHASRR